jgi:hypothetical protein
MDILQYIAWKWMGASVNRNVFLLKQEYRFTRLYGYITSNAMGWNLPCIIKLPYLFPIYNMDVTNIVYQDSTYLYMYSNLTSYWTILMTNNGHYLYMLKKWNIYILDKKTIVTLVTKWKIQQTIITWKEYENLQQTSHIMLKDISCIFLIVFI